MMMRMLIKKVEMVEIVLSLCSGHNNENINNHQHNGNKFSSFWKANINDVIKLIDCKTTKVYIIIIVFVIMAASSSSYT